MLQNTFWGLSLLAILMVFAGQAAAQDRQYADTARPVIINNYYFGCYPYYPAYRYVRPYPASYFHVSFFIPLRPRILVLHPFRHRFIARPVGHRMFGGRRY